MYDPSNSRTAQRSYIVESRRQRWAMGEFSSPRPLYLSRYQAWWLNGLKQRTSLILFFFFGCLTSNYACFWWWDKLKACCSPFACFLSSLSFKFPQLIINFTSSAVRCPPEVWNGVFLKKSNILLLSLDPSRLISAYLDSHPSVHCFWRLSHSDTSWFNQVHQLSTIVTVLDIYLGLRNFGYILLIPPLSF